MGTPASVSTSDQHDPMDSNYMQEVAEQLQAIAQRLGTTARAAVLEPSALNRTTSDASNLLPPRSPQYQDHRHVTFAVNVSAPSSAGSSPTVTAEQKTEHVSMSEILRDRVAATESGATTPAGIHTPADLRPHPAAPHHAPHPLEGPRLASRIGAIDSSFFAAPKLQSEYLLQEMPDVHTTIQIGHDNNDRRQSTEYVDATQLALDGISTLRLRHPFCAKEIRMLSFDVVLFLNAVLSNRKQATAASSGMSDFGHRRPMRRAQRHSREIVERELASRAWELERARSAQLLPNMTTQLYQQGELHEHATANGTLSDQVATVQRDEYASKGVQTINSAEDVWIRIEIGGRDRDRVNFIIDPEAVTADFDDQSARNGIHAEPAENTTDSPAVSERNKEHDPKFHASSAATIIQPAMRSATSLPDSPRPKQAAPISISVDRERGDWIHPHRSSISEASVDREAWIDIALRNKPERNVAAEAMNIVPVTALSDPVWPAEGAPTPRPNSSATNTQDIQAMAAQILALQDELSLLRSQLADQKDVSTRSDKQPAHEFQHLVGQRELIETSSMSAQAGDGTSSLSEADWIPDNDMFRGRGSPPFVAYTNPLDGKLYLLDTPDGKPKPLVGNGTAETATPLRTSRGRQRLEDDGDRSCPIDGNCSKRVERLGLEMEGKSGDGMILAAADDDD